MSSSTPGITVAEIKKVAHLARLHLEEADVKAFSQSLPRILELIAELSSQDTSKVQAMTSPFQDAKLALRPDEVTAENQRDLLQKLAPNVTEGLYIVPKVIE